MLDTNETTDGEKPSVDAQITDYLNMSDEEAMNLVDMPDTTSFDDFRPEAEAEEVESEEEKENTLDEPDVSDAEAGEAEADSEDDVTEDSDALKEELPEETLEEETAEKETQAAHNTDDFFTAVTAPFKANGKEMTVTDPDDVIQLMQMGANYNKKMAALKPNLKLMKLLEKNELLSEDKLNFLIDIDQKNPKAIAKLLKDSNIDPLDIDQDADADYAPSKHTVDDAELAFDEVISVIQDTPTFSTTLEIVGDKWDNKSKLQVRESPQLLKIINDQVANGIYDTISQQVDKERMFGRLEGLSDIEAYHSVGDKIDKEGGFDHLNLSQAKVEPKTTPAQKILSVAKPAVKDVNLKDKKRAASPTKAGAPKAKAKQDYSYLALSDDEFEKQFNAKFL